MYINNETLRNNHINSCFKFFTKMYNKLPYKLLNMFNDSKIFVNNKWALPWAQ